MNNWNRTIDFLTRLSSAVPIVIMVVLMILAVFNIQEDIVMKYAPDFGTSTIVFIPFIALYFNRKFKFCLLTKCMLAGLILNHLLYKIGAYINYEIYSNLYTILCGVSASVLFGLILFMNKKTK